MLKRVHIRGFKSLADVEVRLEPLTVLFGPHASGVAGTCIRARRDDRELPRIWDRILRATSVCDVTPVIMPTLPICEYSP